MLQKNLCFIVFLSLLLTVTPLYSQNNERPGDFYSIETQPSVEIRIQVTPEQPSMSENVVVNIVLTSHANFQNAKGIIELPSGFKLLLGELFWEGNLSPGVETSIEITILALQQPTESGRFTLDLGTGETIWQDFEFAQSPITALEMKRPVSLPVDNGYTPKNVADSRVEDLTAHSISPLPIADFSINQTHDGDLFSFTVFALPNYTSDQAAISVSLPANLALESGNLNWEGSVKQGDVLFLEFKASRFSKDAGMIEVLYVANNDAASYSYWIPSLVPSANNDITALGTFNMSGRFVYDENLSTTVGAYFAHVDVYENDGGGILDDYVCSATTNSNGYWSCSGPAADDGLFDDTVELYAIVSALNSNYGKVMTNDLIPIQYSARTSDIS